MKTVAYSCAFVPCEWIAAHGLRPWRVCPPAAAGSFLGAAEGICPYARAFIAAAGDPAFDAVVVTTLCDQMRRGSELIRRGGDRPVFLMNVPSTWQRPEAFALYVEELKRLGRFLTSLGGRAPTDGQLAEVMLEYDNRRQVLAARPNMAAKAHTQALLEIARGGEAPPQQRPRRAVDEGVPVALVGGALRQEDFEIFDLIEEAGGRVVLDATDSGERALPAALDGRRMQAAPLLELARAYFSIPHAFRRPNDPLYDYLQKELSARSVRAVIFRRLSWCDLWNAELGRLRDVLSIPVLALDIGGDGEDPSHRAGRVQALLEIVR